jgi:dTDP-4-amino-4,6-dideoxygalactose transaminase
MRLDIGWADLASALVGIAARRPEARARRIEGAWSEDALVCFSVRSALDLLLSAAALPAESEVLCSAINIPNMAELLSRHGLVPVPLDVDPETLLVSPARLEAAIGPRTRAVLLAHLFGTRAELGSFGRIARAHGLLLLEDCAQAFCGDGYRGHDGADASFFSFGMIKTATALGGALARVRSPALRARMRDLQAAYPFWPRRLFLARAAKAGLLKLVSAPPCYTAFCALCGLRGADLDVLLHRAVRGFPGDDWMERIRRRPPAPLLALLERRQRSYKSERVAPRAGAGRRLLGALGATLESPGAAGELHTYWVFPLLAPDPERAVRGLRRAGFDATRMSSLRVLEPPAGSDAPHPRESRSLLERIVYVPVVPELSPAEWEALTGALAELEVEPAPERGVPVPRPGGTQ